MLRDGQLQIQRGLREAFVVDGTGEIKARGDRSYMFDFDPLAPIEIETARTDGILIMEDWENNEFRAVVNLVGYLNEYLYVSREVDGSILKLLDETQETALFYQQQESERGRRLVRVWSWYILASPSFLFSRLSGLAFGLPNAFRARGTSCGCGAARGRGQS